MRIAVLGAGVVGTAAAYALARDGHEVELIERREAAGLETSYANGGQLTAACIEPWAAPGALRLLLASLGRPTGPFVVRPRLDPAMWGFGLRFLANCTRARAAAATRRLRRLAFLNRAELARLRRETAIAYDGLDAGILHLYDSAEALAEATAGLTELDALGEPYRVLDAAQCAAVEPALAHSRRTFAGGVYFPGDASGDAHKFTCALAALAAGRGVRFRHGITIEGLAVQGRRVRAVQAGGEPVEADAYVLSLGCASRRIARTAGLRLPIHPVKGYSLTLPIARPERAPRAAITDKARKVVTSRLGDRLRIAGTAELAGYDLGLDPLRIGAVRDAAAALFPEAGDLAGAEAWAGLRPMTPDSLPILGASPIENLFLDTGHGPLGWSLAMASARVVADLVSGRAPSVDLEGLTLARFGGGAGG